MEDAISTETFANRFVEELSTFSDLVSAAVEMNKREKAAVAKTVISDHPDDAELNNVLHTDLSALAPKIDQVKQEFGKISEKAILKKSVITPEDIALLRKKDLLATQYFALVQRKIEALEDYQYLLEQNREQRQEAERRQKMDEEVQAKEEEEMRESAAFFLDEAVDPSDALLEKTLQIMTAVVDDEEEAIGFLVDVVQAIRSSEKGRERLQMVYADGVSVDSTILSKRLIDLYRRASATTLD